MLSNNLFFPFTFPSILFAMAIVFTCNFEQKNFVQAPNSNIIKLPGANSSDDEAKSVGSDDFDDEFKGIWKFFTSNQRNPDQAKCKLCDAKIHFMRNGKDSGDLELHMQIVHLPQFKSYTKWRRNSNRSECWTTLRCPGLG